MRTSISTTSAASSVRALDRFHACCRPRRRPRCRARPRALARTRGGTARGRRRAGRESAPRRGRSALDGAASVQPAASISPSGRRGGGTAPGRRSWCCVKKKKSCPSNSIWSVASSGSIGFTANCFVFTIAVRRSARWLGRCRRRRGTVAPSACRSCARCAVAPVRPAARVGVASAARPCRARGRARSGARPRRRALHEMLVDVHEISHVWESAAPPRRVLRRSRHRCGARRSRTCRSARASPASATAARGVDFRCFPTTTTSIGPGSAPMARRQYRRAATDRIRAVACARSLP